MALMADDLMQFPRRYLTTTLECAGNGRAFMGPPVPGEPWRLGAVSTAEWHGVSLADVLERAEVNAAAVEILFEGADGFARSLTVKEALHPDTLLADRMNGEQLTPEHGAPLRLLVPGWYGMASVKWLSSITARRTPFRGHFQTERYVIGDRGVREMRVRALILEPARWRNRPAREPNDPWTGVDRYRAHPRRRGERRRWHKLAHGHAHRSAPRVRVVTMGM